MHRVVLSAVMFSALTPLSVAHALQGARWESFDSSRVMIRDTTFWIPFHVTETTPLRQAIDDGTIGNDTRILIVERGGNRVALVMDQAAYHHVIQGEMNGEPWMVSF